MESKTFGIDREALESLFAEAIKQAAADVIRSQLPVAKVEEAIAHSFVEAA
jgi:hypothetical protein